MKLTIPKPISEIDITHEDPISKSHNCRNPNYTNDTYPRGNGAIYIGNGQYADGDFRQSILDDCNVEGFTPGATVVHKKIQMNQRVDPLCWGIIISVNSIGSRATSWKPLRVKWLSGSFEDLHATDLILMIHVPDKSILKRRALGEPIPNPL